MTDNEIIKALECCTTKGASCKNCPAFVKVDRSNCKKAFLGALDIINRQKAEIEVLEARIGVYETCNARKDEAIRGLEAEIERLNNITSASAIGIMADIAIEVEKKKPRFIHEIKAEAIKEFAEKMKEKIRTLDRIIVISEDVDSIAKEMLGEKE